MRLERLTYNKIKIFLTSDDLRDRGLTKEDIWKDTLKWNQLFHDMLEEASDEFDLEIFGAVAVEIFSLQSQGMVLIITVDEEDAEREAYDEGIIEMSVKIDGMDEILFEFLDLEDVIQLAIRLNSAGLGGGSLYSYENVYYLIMEGKEDAAEGLIPLLAEYGFSSLLSIHRLQEYGKEVIQDKAIEKLSKYFT